MRLLPSLLLASAALSGCQICSEPTPWPALLDEPLGGRCTAAAQCAAGLDCIDSTCTVPCPGGACAAGVCFDRRYCLPGCAGDADCQLGTVVGACNSYGAGPGYCYQRSCQSDAECVTPAQAGRCAGLSRASGITWNEFCSAGTCVR